MLQFKNNQNNNNNNNNTTTTTIIACRMAPMCQSFICITSFNLPNKPAVWRVLPTSKGWRNWGSNVLCNLLRITKWARHGNWVRNQGGLNTKHLYTTQRRFSLGGQTSHAFCFWIMLGIQSTPIRCSLIILS